MLMMNTRVQKRLPLYISMAFMVPTLMVMFPTISWAESLSNVVGQDGAAGAEFNALYTFIHNAATGYLGRSIAIVGGIIGLCAAAMMGKALPAIMGVLLAVFGVLGPNLINTIFKSALVI
jgi:conjugal transfer pilus assembly protein TraA